MLTAAPPTVASIEVGIRSLPRRFAGQIARSAEKRVEALILAGSLPSIRDLPMHIETVCVCAGAAAKPDATDTDSDVTYAAWIAVQFAARIAFEVAEARHPGTGFAAEAKAWMAVTVDLARFPGGSRVA